MKQSAMGTSKYEFEPDKFNEDVENKKITMEQFRKDLIDVLYEPYYYRDGTKMSFNTKREILVETHKDFIGWEE